MAADLSDGDDANGEADVVVLLVHDDAEGEIEDGASDDIDAIVAGHTHETYAYQQDSGRPVIQTGQYATNVGHISMTVDPDTDEMTFNAVENLPPMNDDDGDGIYEPNYTPDPEVEAIVAGAVEVADELGAVELGTVTQNITRAFDVAEDDDGNPIRSEESTLGNLVADAQREATVDIPTGEAQSRSSTPVACVPTSATPRASRRAASRSPLPGAGDPAEKFTHAVGGQRIGPAIAASPRVWTHGTAVPPAQHPAQCAG